MTSTPEAIDAILAEACGALNEAARLHKEATSPFGKDFLYKIGEALSASWDARQLLHARCPELVPVATLDHEEPGVHEQFLALLAQGRANEQTHDQLAEAFVAFIASAPPGSYLRGVARLRARFLGLVS